MRWAGLAMASLFRASDRITLYPAAPIRLATMLHTWTITERGMGLIFWTAPSPRRHAVTHPTRQQAHAVGHVGVSMCLIDTGGDVIHGGLRCIMRPDNVPFAAHSLPSRSIFGAGGPSPVPGG